MTNSLKKSISFQTIQNVFQKIEKKLSKQSVDNSDILLKKQNILFEAAELFSAFESIIFEKFSLNARYKMLSLTQEFFTSQPELDILISKISEGLHDIQQDIINL